MTNLRHLLGSNMKIYRRAYGLSQAKLAELADTSTNYISAIEAGRRFPSVEILDKIALALGIDTPELFSIKYTQPDTGEKRIDTPVLFSKKPVQKDMAKQELEEQVWRDIGQNLSSYISKKLATYKKKEK